MLLSVLVLYYLMIIEFIVCIQNVRTNDGITRECVICLQGASMEDGKLYRMCEHQCGQLYHYQCWLRCMDHNKLCPMCRQPQSKTNFVVELQHEITEYEDDDPITIILDDPTHENDTNHISNKTNITATVPIAYPIHYWEEFRLIITKPCVILSFAIFVFFVLLLYALAFTN